MTFFVEKDEGIQELDVSYEEIFREVSKEALSYTGCPCECEVTLTLTDDEGIRRLNREFRDIDSSTDVLSFPLLDFKSPGDYKDVLDDALAFNPDTGDLMLGDIIISTDHVLSQAKEYGHSVKRELAFLIAHSMLHLQGFDHMEPEDSVIMETAQDDILEKLGIRR